MTLGKKNTLIYGSSIVAILIICMTLVFYTSKKIIINQGVLRAETVLKMFESSLNSKQNYSDINLDFQSELNEMKKDIPSLIDFVIYDMNTKKAIASSDQKKLNKDADSEDIESAKQDITKLIIVNENKQLIVDVTAPLHLNSKINYVSGIKISLASEMANINNLLTKIILLGLFSTILSLIVLWYFNIRNTSRKVIALMKVSNEISNGNLTIKAKPEGNDEITELANNINLMSESLYKIIKNVNLRVIDLINNSNKLATQTEDSSKDMEIVNKLIIKLGESSFEQNKEAKIGIENLNSLANQINNIMNTISKIEYDTKRLAN